jgi:hypothetical protein
VDVLGVDVHVMYLVVWLKTSQIVVLPSISAYSPCIPGNFSFLVPLCSGALWGCVVDLPVGLYRSCWFGLELRRLEGRQLVPISFVPLCRSGPGGTPVECAFDTDNMCRARFE